MQQMNKLYTKIFERIADNRIDNSLATRLRRKRFALFVRLISSLPRPLSILDVGGTPLFWQNMRFDEERDVSIVLLNISEDAGSDHPNLTFVTGDARDMRGFKDKEFDVVFSNSVIEHVGSYEYQRQMAQEVMRVGKRYFVQTPNYFFPIEPHFLFPFFQFFPRSLKLFLVRRFDLGWFRGSGHKNLAEVDSIRLLTAREVGTLFPGGTVYRE